MDENRFNEQLKETEEAYGQMLSHLEWLRESDGGFIKGNNSSLLAHMMSLVHLRSTLRYINGEIEDLRKQVSKDAFTTMYHFGMLEGDASKEECLKYALDNDYLELPPKTIESLLASQAP